MRRKGLQNKIHISSQQNSIISYIFIDEMNMYLKKNHRYTGIFYFKMINTVPKTKITIEVSHNGHIFLEKNRQG